MKRLVWLARIGLACLLIGAVGLAVLIILSGRGGRGESSRGERISAMTTRNPTQPIRLPAEGFTLIAEAEVIDARTACAAPAPPQCEWSLIFTAADGTPLYTVTVTGDGYFRLAPPVPDSTPFIHLHHNAPNQLALQWSPGGPAELRLNQEIAWRGALPTAAYARLALGQAELRGVWMSDGR